MAERIIHEMSLRHADYMTALSSAHTAFMSMASQMAGIAGTQPAAPIAVSPPAPMPTQPAVALKANGYHPQPEAAPASQPVAVPPQTVAQPARPAPVAQPAAIAPAAPVTPPAPVSGVDSLALVRGIIAEKTGYPEDMLEADMDLEGELGVDSIKQVEILSTLRERLPTLPEIDPEQLVELRTIAAIAAMIDAATGARPAAAPLSAPAVAAAVPNGAAHAPSSSGGISADIVRTLIAEKTGYPEDMLEDDMDLEGELGVDSIKQVEILSALRDQHPELPEVDPEVLADLRTIRAIADFFA